MRTTISIIGGGGHVGLGLGLVLAEVGHTVYGIDINSEGNEKIMSGVMPFIEKDGDALLRRALNRKLLKMTDSPDPISKSSVIVIIMGTPIDKNLNPNLTPLFTVIESTVLPRLQKGHLILLRSTVSPGTTERVKEMIERKTGWKSGQDFYLAFTPERVLQTRAIEEIRALPQMIGAFEPGSQRHAREFFETFVQGGCIEMVPIEAELAKLITNMARYVEFALANEFYLIAESYGANIHRILKGATSGYPRLRIAAPGPNVGGPCLYKDGFFLIDRIPFTELISTSFKINEGMPIQIVQQIRTLPNVKKVGVLGLTFKADCDDTRNSLSFKLLKQLQGQGYEIVTVDPYVEGCKDFSVLRGCDALVLMTPHSAFHDLYGICETVANPQCWVCDIWGFWPQMRGRSENGRFFLKDLIATEEPIGTGASV